MTSFDLVDGPWLRLRPRSGEPVVELPLREALLRAHDFDGLVVDLPTQAPALLRQVLLPVVLDALGQLPDTEAWAELFSAGEFISRDRERISAYLDEHQARFDLFDAERPFAQVSGLRTAKDETKGVSLLVATAASGNNVPLYSARTEGDPPSLTPAQAARWLLHAHCWDTAAIKTGAAGDPQAKAGKTTGNPTGPLGALGVVIPIGRTLFETIVLNLPTGSRAAGDRPQWRQSQASPRWEERSAEGLLDLWTWQSRRIRLVPEQTSEGIRVRRVVLTAGDRLRQIPEWEPHTAWTIQTTAKSRTGSTRRPRRHMPGKAAWRGLEALLALEREDQDGVETTSLLNQIGGAQGWGQLPLDYPLRVETAGIAYGNQSAVIEDILADAIPLPVAALRADGSLREAVVQVCEQAEELAKAANNLSADLRRASGGDPIPWDRGQRPGELVLHALDPLVRRFLAGVRSVADDDGLIEQGRTAWETLARQRILQIVEPLFAAVPASAFGGRTVTGDKREMTYRLATAELNFHRRVRVILPLALAAERKHEPAAAPSSALSPR